MNIIASIVNKSESLLKKIKNAIQRRTDEHFNWIEKWYKEDPRNLKRTEFDFLTDESIVFDLGGYEGQWSSDIYSRYNCYIHIFEPVKEYSDIISNRFKKNKKIISHQIGLASSNQTVSIAKDEFASKITSSNTSESERIQLRDFNEFLKTYNISTIDLIKINIEGAEFDLLQYLINSHAIKKIDTLLIQFHNFEYNAAVKRNVIKKELSNTHINIFDYPFVWECWRIKK
jgi:FkbM family methyltransferase